MSARLSPKPDVDAMEMACEGVSGRSGPSMGSFELSWEMFASAVSFLDYKKG